MSIQGLVGAAPLGAAPSRGASARRGRAVHVTASIGRDHVSAITASGRRQALLAGGALLGGLLLPDVPSTSATSPAGSESIYDLSALMFDEEVGTVCGVAGLPSGLVSG